MSPENKSQLIFDEFLVEHYKSHILPFLEAEHKERLEKALDDFNRSKYDLEKETDSTVKFYTQLRALSQSLKLMGSSERGIEDLFSTLKRLQKILFQLPFYRDHLPHQMRVYLLGCYLLSEQEEFFVESFSAKYARIIARVTNKEDKAHYNLIRENLYYGLVGRPQILYDAWSFPGLCHDIGYAVEGVSRITDELHDMYHILQPKVRMNLDVKIHPTSLLWDQIKAFQDCLDVFFDSEASNELKEYVSVLKKQNDHGVWGCFFLTSKDLGDKIKENLQKSKKNISDLRIWDLVSGFSIPSKGDPADTLLPILNADAMIAIAFHNRPFLIRLSPFTALLVISDTLQEWNRFAHLLSSTEKYIPRCVYVSLVGEPQQRSVDSEIYVYDCSPTKFYDRVKKDFDANKDTHIDVCKIKGEFVEGFSFVVRIGPPMNKHTLTV